MRLLIIGAGETGYHVAHELSEEKLEVTVIDENPVHLQMIQKELNVACVRGSGTNLSVLEQAGIEQTDMVVASTDQDETNLICCLLAAHYNVPTKIAITKTESFIKRNVISKYLESGISQIINSSMVTAQEILDTAAFASAAEVSAFGEKNVLLIGYRVKPDGPLDNVALKDIRALAMENQFLIASIVRDGDSFIPGGADVIAAGDYVYILLPRESMGRLNDYLKVTVAANRRAVVAGGGQVAMRVVAGLLKSHYEVTQVISEEEHPEVKKQVLANRNFHLVRGAAESVKLQLQLDVPVSALFIATTTNDQVNLAAALSARYLGAKKTIALINREDLALAARSANIDGVVSPRLLTARRVRKTLYSSEGALNFTTISETNMEVHEMVAFEGAEIVGTPLKDIRLPPNCLVGALVVGGNQALIPDGQTVIEAGNQVIMLTLPETAPRLREMVEGKK
ncbi:MAG: Trk system potassium transporter TrkA [bacterium]|nr:Trk system potassium transporter TrkA [bacterium]